MITTRAQRSISLMVVVLAVWLVVDDVEIGRSERLLASAAREALLVPSASQTAIGLILLITLFTPSTSFR